MHAATLTHRRVEMQEEAHEKALHGFCEEIRRKGGVPWRTAIVDDDRKDFFRGKDLQRYVEAHPGKLEGIVDTGALACTSTAAPLCCLAPPGPHRHAYLRDAVPGVSLARDDASIPGASLGAKSHLQELSSHATHARPRAAQAGRRAIRSSAWWSTCWRRRRWWRATASISARTRAASASSSSPASSRPTTAATRAGTPVRYPP